MNMKKVIASVIAGAVAVSAMATSAFAEETTKTFKLTGEQWKASYSKTTTGTAAYETAAAGDVVFTFDTAMTGVKSTVTIATWDSVGSKDTSTRTADVVFKADDTKKIYTAAIKTTGSIIDDGELALATNEYIKAAKMTFTAEVIKDTDPKPADTLTVNATSVTGPLTGAGAFTAFNTKPVVLKGTIEKVTKNGTALLDDSKENDIADSYVAYANDFFKGASNGKIVFEFTTEAKDAADGELAKPEAPSMAVAFGGTTGEAAKHFALALNRVAGSKMVSVADIDGNKVSFNWADCVAAMGGDTYGKVFDMDLFMNDVVPESFKSVSLASITYVKDDAAATTEAPATEAPADETTTTPADKNPPTGAAPVALALIPAALAAVVVAKKRK